MLGSIAVCSLILVRANSLYSTPTQLNHSLRPPPQVTVCLEDFLRAPHPPLVMTIAKMQRQPTWQQQPFSTSPPAAGKDRRLSAPSPGSRAPRYTDSSWDLLRLVQWCTIHSTLMFSVYELCRSLTLKWMKMALWTSVWRRPRGRACSLQSLLPARLHPLNTSEPPCLRATLRQSGRGHWTLPNQVESKRRTMKRYCTHPGELCQSHTRCCLPVGKDLYELCVGYLCFYLSSGWVYGSLIHLIWLWGREPGEPGGQEVPWWGHHHQLQGQVSAQR